MRHAVLLGPSGEVYEPDGRGAWVRRQRFTTAGALSFAGLAGARDAIVAFGDGVVYRLAANGWTAVRLAQKGKAIMSRGGHGVAAVGRQLYALDSLDGGEPTKLGVAPAAIVAIGSGKSVAVATARGVFRIRRGGQTAIKNAPAGVRALIGDEWALVDGGVVELRTGKRISWPEGLEIATATTGPNDRLIAVAIANERATTSAGGRSSASGSQTASVGGSPSASVGGSSSASAG
ncbi:MAG: hypothetical protein ACTHU0_34405, partial [Kofleriaceae bacterium]